MAWLWLLLYAVIGYASAYIALLTPMVTYDWKEPFKANIFVVLTLTILWPVVILVFILMALAVVASELHTKFIEKKE